MASEGSAEQNRDLTNRNRISGILGGTSGRLTAKCRSIKGQGCRSGRRAGKATELTWGGLRHVPSSELRAPRGGLTVAQESADGVVGQPVGKASEALQRRKAEQRIGRAGNEGRRPERWEWQVGLATHEWKAAEDPVFTGLGTRRTRVKLRSAAAKGPNQSW